MSMPPVNIVRAESAGEYRIRLWFDDGTEQVVDFHPFLSHARHPAIRAYLDPSRFASWRIEYGELVWGDYELCFPIADLYHNSIATPAALKEAA
ncbi:DUF2442 domain-containing protein [Sulfuricystis thermophila]|uniref:DUF2442 domain-containing protein n=1 Tax=Sulfuricystis thermophila TaxID=2496847 RepID=UPI0024DF5700|nr:DUF2442 domain-containing protein [Sulfuricystis thermophila]